MRSSVSQRRISMTSCISTSGRSTAALLLTWPAAGLSTIAAASCSKDIPAPARPSWAARWQKKPAVDSTRPGISVSRTFWGNMLRSHCFPVAGIRYSTIIFQSFLSFISYSNYSGIYRPKQYATQEKCLISIMYSPFPQERF